MPFPALFVNHPTWFINSKTLNNCGVWNGSVIIFSINNLKMFTVMIFPAWINLKK
jgi:hypothetical protein